MSEVTKTRKEALAWAFGSAALAWLFFFIFHLITATDIVTTVVFANAFLFQWPFLAMLGITATIQFLVDIFGQPKGYNYLSFALVFLFLGLLFFSQGLISIIISILGLFIYFTAASVAELIVEALF